MWRQTLETLLPALKKEGKMEGYMVRKVNDSFWLQCDVQGFSDLRPPQSSPFRRVELPGGNGMLDDP